MDKSDKLKIYFNQEHPFKEGINQLRRIILKSGLEETYKWSFPTYMLDSKNILAICKFKTHFGLWFFNGVFLSDPEKVLENVQEGKTKAMRHWKFYSNDAMNRDLVKSYIEEAIANYKIVLGLGVKRERKETKPITRILLEALKSTTGLKDAFFKLSDYKQGEYSEYIDTAKREQTKQTRIEKIIPMIFEGKGLNDMYRK